VSTRTRVAGKSNALALIANVGRSMEENNFRAAFLLRCTAGDERPSRTEAEHPHLAHFGTVHAVEAMLHTNKFKELNTHVSEEL
jgi:hypothetical protein